MKMDYVTSGTSREDVGFDRVVFITYINRKSSFKSNLHINDYM